MRNLTFLTDLVLCSLSWISVSGSETVEVHRGEDVTLLCSNFSSSPSQIIWFKLVNRTQPRCVSSVYSSIDPASICGGFENGKIELRSNISTLFLKIKQVNFSDSGLYFCGYSVGTNPVIVDATYLEVQDVFDGIAKPISVILGGLIIFLVMVVICLAVKIRKLQKAHVEEQNPQRNKTQGSDDLNYAAVTFRPKATRNHRPASEEVVTYAAPR